MKKQWVDDKVNVGKLHLDLQNPRVPKHVKVHNDIGLIRNYLLEKEEVLRIAKNIVNNGYHRSAVAIVCKENNRLVVLDGNRRLAACQLLLNPNLAPNARAKKDFEELNKALDKSQLEKVKVTIAPTRKAAEKEIWDIHVNQLLKPWQVLQKLRMYRNLIDDGAYNVTSASREYGISQSDFQNELGKLYFFEKILGNHPEAEGILLDSGFNKIERVILGGHGRTFLNFSFDNKGNVIPANEKEFNGKLEKLVPYIVDSAKVSAQARQDWIKDNIFSILDPIKFPKGKNPVKVAAKIKTRTISGTHAKPNWITHADYLNFKGADRVKRMLKEMSQLEPENYYNTLCPALRVLLELALYDKLKSTRHINVILAEQKADFIAQNNKRIEAGKGPLTFIQNWSPSFNDMITYILNPNKNIINDPQESKALQLVVQGQGNFVTSLDNFIHNVSYLPSKADPEIIWGKLGRLLFEIIEKIK